MNTKELAEFKEMDIFVDTLIDEGAKKRIPFYVRLKEQLKNKQNEGV